jgi:hypothetical protein
MCGWAPLRSFAGAGVMMKGRGAEVGWEYGRFGVVGCCDSALEIAVHLLVQGRVVDEVGGLNCYSVCCEPSMGLVGFGIRFVHG